ncbi:MAG TPA: hypothetical protein PJ984_00370 [Candidatus Saccharibacteria bacterium]|jgi:hypothetical protein|nr:hypothetical protein [Candidatus Saccharibacteria bacterium]
MELVLTPKQRKQVDNSGLMSAETLQRVYKKSVQDQQKTLIKAEKLRKKK